MSQGPGGNWAAYTCPFCNTPSAGNTSSCPGCGAAVNVALKQTQSGWVELPPARDMARIQIGRSSVQIEGTMVPAADFALAQGDSVFYITGTRDQLKRAGVISETGGTKLPLLGTIGRTIVPARMQNEKGFAVIDRRRDLAIALPESTHAYRIVSAHDPALLEPAQPNNPVVRGTLHIRDPQRFWSQSRFLVLVDEDPASRTLLRAGWLIARGIEGELLVAYFERERTPMAEKAIAGIVELAEDLNASVRSLSGEPSASALSALLQAEHVRHLVLTRPKRRLLRKSLLDEVLEELPHISVHIPALPG